MVKSWVEEKIEFQKSQIPQKKLADGGWREINEECVREEKDIPETTEETEFS